MINPPSGKQYSLTVIPLLLLACLIPIFPIGTGMKIALSAFILLLLISVIISYIKAANRRNIIESLIRVEKGRDRSIATVLLNDLLSREETNRSRGELIAETLVANFKLGQFALFNRERDKLVARISHGIKSSSLGRPKVSRVKSHLSAIPPSGKAALKEEFLNFLFRKRDWEYFESMLCVVHQWDRSRLTILVADDDQGLLGQAVENPEFNNVLWPALDSFFRQDFKLSEAVSENNKLRSDLASAKKDLNSLNRDLNQKLLDLHSFVEISGELYTIFNEDQLFKSLREIVRSKIGAADAEILCSDGNGRFVPITKEKEDNLVLDMESGLFNMLKDNQKPLLLPLVSAGSGKDDKFLAAAVDDKFQIATSIRVGNKMGCVLLVSERADKKRYTDSDLDFISTIANIASLSLENIRQYTTIEKLSYTDSMTGIYNYRYFYKRLIEEILRAKRFSRNLALVILDIDNFKIFNDKFGHQTGDLVLKRLAKIITDTIRSIDVVSRYGGEEFCIIMPDTDSESCAVFIERLRSVIAGFRLDSELPIDDNMVTVSVGGAVFPQHAGTADRLIYCADMALLKAKAGGRNTAIMYQADFSDKEETSIGGYDAK